MVSVLDELTEADLARILTEPKNALVKQYRKMFAVDGVDLVFTEQAVNAIASTAITRGTGARGLRSIIEKTLEETMFELPGVDDVQQVIVDAASVRGEGLPNWSVGNGASWHGGDARGNFATRARRQVAKVITLM